MFALAHLLRKRKYVHIARLLSNKWNKCQIRKQAGRGSSIGSVYTCHASGPKFDPHVRHILLWRLGHEKMSTAILLLPLIQKEQLSVNGERRLH